jgi:hypothetical protein
MTNAKAYIQTRYSNNPKKSKNVGAKMKFGRIKNPILSEQNYEFVIFLFKTNIFQTSQAITLHQQHGQSVQQRVLCLAHHTNW